MRFVLNAQRQITFYDTDHKPSDQSLSILCSAAKRGLWVQNSHVVFEPIFQQYLKELGFTYNQSYADPEYTIPACILLWWRSNEGT